MKIGKQIRQHRKLAISTLTTLVGKPGLNRQIDNFVNLVKLFARSHQLNPVRLQVTQFKVLAEFHVCFGELIFDIDEFV